MLGFEVEPVDPREWLISNANLHPARFLQYANLQVKDAV
jgi:hypothetical protein